MATSLESVLECPSSPLFQEFATFLNQSYCMENLDFWLATQEYHKNQQLGQDMINLYIRPNSPQEINIPCDMRRAILEQRQFDKHLFDEAAEAVMELMRINSFIPWMYQRRTLQHSTSAHTLLSAETNPIQHQRRCSSLDSIRPHGNGLNLDRNGSANTRYKAMLKKVKKTLLFGRPML